MKRRSRKAAELQLGQMFGRWTLVEIGAGLKAKMGNVPGEPILPSGCVFVKSTGRLFITGSPGYLQPEKLSPLQLKAYNATFYPEG